jgi:hypothetical protein
VVRSSAASDVYKRQEHAIDSGEALKVLERLAALTHAQA